MPDRARRWLASVVTVALALVVVFGFVDGEPSETDRVAALGTRIRCPVCQGEPIADSPSETARAMMRIVSERVASGESDAQIVEYFRTRYGDWVVLDPPFRGATLLLWLLPLVALGAGVGLIASRRRRVPDSQVDA
ncbi:MAG TPA: cytochrome c-type biogenesis protein CcmH [Acidimicrobiia bacterium]|nr:cytochrome c-type biogenesis protein CcmH [Acidimicrobiia bacterium]